MKTATIFLALLLAAGMLGCGRPPEPRHIVILPDVSGSIDRQALKQAFKAIDEFVGHLQRGDRITVIPIFGDAQAEASGQIIRFEVPKERRAYDADLRDFRRKLSGSLAEMQANAAAHLGANTDILGSVALAEQEFRMDSTKLKPILLILSDFLQEDREVSFVESTRLANRAAAKSYARYIAGRNVLNLKRAYIYLGFLRSREYVRMQRTRREAIQEFWLDYFKLLGRQITFANDGPGLLQDVLGIQPEEQSP